jgi:ankyrin repeat protein
MIAMSMKNTAAVKELFFLVCRYLKETILHENQLEDAGRITIQFLYAKDVGGLTAIHQAALYGNSDLIEEYLKESEDALQDYINTVDNVS